MARRARCRRGQRGVPRFGSPAPRPPSPCSVAAARRARTRERLRLRPPGAATARTLRTALAVTQRSEHRALSPR